MTSLIKIGSANGSPVGILPHRANRHGFVAGATGTGKTVTLHTMAEQFSRAGVPVFMADIKGDLTGIGQPDRGPACPVNHLDLYGQTGREINIRLASMGPELVSRMLELSETQEGVMVVAFHVAVAQRMPMDTLDQLSSIIRYMGANAAAVSERFGRCSPTTLATIQRKILMLQGTAGAIFGRGNLEIDDIMQVRGGQGVVTLLDATNLINNPNMYSTFLLWLLGELFKKLPEVGDLAKPKLVFFFDEAHLLFRDAPKALMERVEQTVRLIRSKGVGIYFVSQKPADIPEQVLSQLSNRIQHALRAYTPNEQRALKAAAASFRANPTINASEVLQSLKVGQALVSTLDANGTPSVVQIVNVNLPESKVGPADSKYLPVIKSPKAYQPQVDRNAGRERVEIDFKSVQKGARVARKVWRGGLLALVFNR